MAERQGMLVQVLRTADAWAAGEPTGQYSVTVEDNAAHVRDENALLVAEFATAADAHGFVACVNVHDELVKHLDAALVCIRALVTKCKPAEGRNWDPMDGLMVMATEQTCAAVLERARNFEPREG